MAADPSVLQFDSSVVLEDDPDESPLEIAPDRRRVRTDKQDVPVETLHTRVQRGRINLQPEFQRNFVWTNAKASRLVESLLLDIPIPIVYVAEEPNGVHAVVDGQQRLTSICAFIDGDFPDGRDFRLSSLQVLTELNGKHFRDLSPELQEAILTTTLRLIVIEKESDPDVKFEVFERLNLGAEKLNDQELRNSVYRGPYNNLLRDLAGNSYMLRIMGHDAPHKRMLDRQLILRFFAMRRNSHLNYRGPMKRFMNREMEEHRNPTDQELARLRGLFEKSIEMAWHVFGTSAFRRFTIGREGRPDGEWERNRLNVALWDTILYGLSFHEKPQVIPIADAIREEFLDLVANDPTFVEYIITTGDKPERIKYRAEAWLGRLREVIGQDRPETRTFSRELKRQLFEANPTCQICGQHIHDLDDAEVDHLQHYWRGGRTIPENARLAHRYCNRARGGRD
jgi:hypothetical protein